MSSTSSSLPGSMIHPSISQASIPTIQICAGAPSGGERCPSDEFVEFFDGIDWAGERVARWCVGPSCRDNDGVTVCRLAGGRKGGRFGCVEF